MEAFELRLWDGRLGRWLTVDPMGQYNSPYLGMGNNPANRIDPNGGSDAGPGDPIPSILSGNFTYGPEKEYTAGTFKLATTYVTATRAPKASQDMVSQVQPTWRDKWATSWSPDTWWYGGPISYGIANDIGIFAQQFFTTRSVRNGTVRNIDGSGTSFDQTVMSVSSVGSLSTFGISSEIGNLKSVVSAEEAVWAQKTYGAAFSAEGSFSGYTISDVAGALRSGTLSVADVPIDVIVRNGQTFILNTRSSIALTEAGIERSAWNVVNRTGVASYEARLTGQLTRNNILNGTTTVKQSVHK